MKVVRGNTTYEGSWWSVLRNLWKLKAQDLVSPDMLTSENQSLSKASPVESKGQED